MKKYHKLFSVPTFPRTTKTTIIVPTLNSDNISEQCLRGSRNRQNCDFELFVVENGSLNKTQRTQHKYAN